MKHVNITITGRVQRVGFRFSAMEAAFRFSINGFVKNVDYDSVYIEAEGMDENIGLFLAWCGKGPLGARVDQVQVEEAPMKNFTGFEILSRF
jgi:acylphosphatase